jgi:hypothetical protein
MIYMTVPNYPDPQAPGQTFTAYAIVAQLSADFTAGIGQVALHFHRTQAAMTAGAQPVSSVVLYSGIGPMPTLATIESDNSISWTAIWQYLFSQIIASGIYPGATVVSA